MTFCDTIGHLKAVGLRPTRQRVALADLLFGSGDRHLTAETLYHEARDAGVQVSLATIYNTLHQFTSAGLLREVPVDVGQSYFDTKVVDHHHFFVPESGVLFDIPNGSPTVTDLPEPPEGYVVDKVEVVIKLRSEPSD